jgi:hypothetical protein
MNGLRGEALSKDPPQRVRDECAAQEECTASGPWRIARRPEWSVSAPSARGGSIVRHTIIRSLPKFGCGVPEGMGTTTCPAAIILEDNRNTKMGGVP